MERLHLNHSLCRITVPYRDKTGEIDHGQGNGVFIDTNKVLTCWHVIEDAAGPITLANDNNEAAQLQCDPTHNVFFDPVCDLAIIDLNTNLGKNRALKVLRKSTLKAKSSLGLRLAAHFKNTDIEEPVEISDMLTVEFQAASMISAAHTVFKTAAEVRPGFSGAPIINQDGEVISLATQTFTSTKNTGPDTFEIHYGNLDGGPQNRYFVGTALHEFAEFIDNATPFAP